jgi:outer membrane protein TolC
MQQLATREARIIQIKQEVLQAADALDTAWQRILTARRRVLLQARLLSAQTRQFELGLSTGLEVSQARAELADAQLAEIEALRDYEIARVDLAVATGTVIGKNRVVLGE